MSRDSEQTVINAFIIFAYIGMATAFALIAAAAYALARIVYLGVLAW